MDVAEPLVMEQERLTAEMAFSDSSSIVIRIRRKLPDFLHSVKLKYVKLGLRSSSIPTAPFFVPLLAVAAAGLALRLDLRTGFCAVFLAAMATAVYLLKSPRPVYLVDFACYKPADELKISKDGFIEMTESTGAFNAETLAFQARITKRSGLGDETYLPAGVQARPPRLDMAEARMEAEAVIFGCLDALFQRTGVDPSKEVGILVVNCSLFNPTPSLAEMVADKYSMRPDLKCFNLGGMGCSAGLISLDLVKYLLQTKPNTYAVMVGTENITLNWYFGNDRSMLMSNCIFRMGGAAVLLSNKASEAARAKYRLMHVVRTHKGADNGCHGSVYQREDDASKLGVSLSRELMAVAGDALKTNITTLGPLVLPLSEQLKFLATLVGRRAFGMKRVRPYIPDFKKAFEHFCVHAGGRAVLEEVEKNLGLGEKEMEPGRSALHRWGNTGNSTVWYELSYAEAKGRVRRGHRVWQIGFGSGFKCNSAVWRALRDVPPVERDDRRNPWADCIDQYPAK